MIQLLPGRLVYVYSGGDIATHHSEQQQVAERKVLLCRPQLLLYIAHLLIYTLPQISLNFCYTPLLSLYINYTATTEAVCAYNTP